MQHRRFPSVYLRWMPRCAIVLTLPQINVFDALGHTGRYCVEHRRCEQHSCARPVSVDRVSPALHRRSSTTGSTARATNSHEEFLIGTPVAGEAELPAVHAARPLRSRCRPECGCRCSHIPRLSDCARRGCWCRRFRPRCGFMCAGRLQRKQRRRRGRCRALRPLQENVLLEVRPCAHPRLPNLS